MWYILGDFLLSFFIEIATVGFAMVVHSFHKPRISYTI